MRMEKLLTGTGKCVGDAQFVVKIQHKQVADKAFHRCKGRYFVVVAALSMVGMYFAYYLNKDKVLTFEEFC